MQVDLYQRRGLYGLGVVDPATGLDSSAPIMADTTPAISTPSIDLSSLSNIGNALSGQSPYVVLGLGALGLWVLSSVFSGTKRAYSKVSAPIKRHRKRRRALDEAEEDYRRKRKRIQEGKY